MDYKYIEQLLERYWACETTPGEEEILRTFFSQPNVPAALARYKDLFVCLRQQKLVAVPGEEFDERVCRLAEEAVNATPVVVKARRQSLRVLLRPLYHAAASVAIVVLLGTAAQHAFQRPEENAGWDYDATMFKDSYNSPQEAYETLDNELDGLKDAFLVSRPDSEKADSLRPAYDNGNTARP